MAGNGRQLDAPRTASFYKGNAVADNVGESGWFLGQFVPDIEGLRHQRAVELKWGIHRRGDRRVTEAAANRFATTISILVRGALRIDVIGAAGRTAITLLDEGDYLVFGPDVAHSWEALQDAVVLSVRYPSIDVWQRGEAGSAGEGPETTKPYRSA